MFTLKGGLAGQRQVVRRRKMTSTQCVVDWWKTGGRRQFSPENGSVASIWVTSMNRPQSVLRDIRVTDEDGNELGVVVAPRRDFVLAANGPTIYLQRTPAEVSQGRGQAA